MYSQLPGNKTVIWQLLLISSSTPKLLAEASVVTYVSC